MDKKSLKGNVLLMTTAIIWGLAFVAQRVGGELMGAFSFNSIRFALGGISLIPLVIIFHKKAYDIPVIKGIKEVIPAGILMGSVLFFAASLQQFGIIYTTVGNTAFITGLYIILVPFLGLFFKQRVNRQTWIAGMIAVVGLYFLSINKGFSIKFGDYFQLAGAFFWASHILLIDHFSKKYDAIKLSMVQFLSCAVLSAIVAVFAEVTTLQMVFDARVPLLYGGLMSVGVAYTLQVVGQKYAKASHAAIILSLESVYGAIGAAIILGEVLSIRGYFGAALMLAGMLLSQIRFKSTQI